MLDENYIKESIMEAEGYRDTVYMCTENHRTIGWGHKCVEDHWKDNTSYPEGYLKEIFDIDFNKAKEKMNTLVKLEDLEHIDHSAKLILVEMIFQMGMRGVQQFRNMIKSLHKQEYKSASLHMLDSKWNRQTPSRAQNLSNMMSGLQS